MCCPWHRWKRNASRWWAQLSGKTENPNKRRCNKVLKGQKYRYGYKCLFIQGRSSHSDTTRARGEEEQGRHSFNCTTSVLVERAPHGMAIQSDSTALLQRSQAAAAAQTWEQPLSVHMWGGCRGVRMGTMFLQRGLCQRNHGAAGNCTPVKTASLNVPSDNVAP